ncbi:MAG: DUF1828 domain-containing protein [Synergistaceae bacterium]|jgi:hypothetical protein|nr:DUF1828 domain-containing protein [Synergistaceae bacterium]
MSADDLSFALSRTLKAVEVHPRGINDYQVRVPFYFDDGDALKIILEKTADNKWNLTDEGNTVMHLDYNDVDISEGTTRKEVFEKILSSHFLTYSDGRLVMPDIDNEKIGAAIFTFTQGLLKIGDIAMWKKERVKSMFMEYFRNAIDETMSGREHHFDYHYPEHDPQKIYPVDCVIYGRKNLRFHLYAANGEAKALRSTVTMYYYNSNGVKAPSGIVFDPDNDLSKNTRNQAGDVADKTFSGISAIPERLPAFIEKYEAA